MAKEAKETEVKVDKSPVIEETSNACMDINCNCKPTEVPTTKVPSNWEVVDDKATEVRLLVLSALDKGINNGAGLDYIQALANIYQCIK